MDEGNEGEEMRNGVGDWGRMWDRYVCGVGRGGMLGLNINRFIII